MKYTIDPEARYLDPERVIRELEEAERNHELDAAGVIEALREAYRTCDFASDRHNAKAVEYRKAGDAYIIARGKYLAEIKRRVELPRGGIGAELKTTERPGWANWCKVNGVQISHSYAYIAAANGDMSKINKHRDYHRERNRRRFCPDPLKNLRRLWGYLTPAQREKFIRWALSFKDYAPADQPAAKTAEYQQREHQVANA